MLRLEEIKLTCSHLVALPDSFSKLSSLRILDISNDPKCFNDRTIFDRFLKNLSNLALRKNNLNKIPHQIGDMKNLQNLDLYLNKIYSVPLQITNLKNLKMVNLAQNPIKVSKMVQGFFNEMEKTGLIVNN